MVAKCHLESRSDDKTKEAMSAGIRIDVEDCAKQRSGTKASGAQLLVLEFGLFRSLLALSHCFLFSSLLLC